MFVETLNQVTDQTRRECQGIKYVKDYLIHAIDIWCNQLKIPQDIVDYIQNGYNQHEIINFTIYIYKEGRTEMNNLNRPNPFYQHINDLWNRINIRGDNIKFIVLIAFAITAIGYFIYIINQQKQQETNRREEPEESNSNPLAPKLYAVQMPPTPIHTGQKNTKPSLVLVLVISASQAKFLESLKDKKHIDASDGEQLYQITRYLWLGTETKLSENRPDINQYSVAKGAESEYNIYLVEIKLKQDDEGFKPNVNQIDRFDAFRKLADLAVDVTVSPRLQIEAYGNIGVYNR